MDKEPISTKEQKALYDECLKIYHTTVRGGEITKLIDLDFCEIKLRYPENGMISRCLSENRSQNNFYTYKNGITIYITDNFSEGFIFPDCPYERFRFTHRGDILGFEEGCFKAVYTRKPALLTVVNLKTNCAVLLFRDAANIDKTDLANTILPALANLLKKFNIFVIPAKLQHNNYGIDLLININLNVSKLNSETLKREQLRQGNNLVMIKAGSQPKAIDINASISLTTKQLSTKESKTFKINRIIEANNREAREIDLYNSLIFKTLSLIPYAQKEYINFIDDSIFLADQNKDYSRLNQYLSPFTANRSNIKENYCSSQGEKISASPKLSIIIPTYNSAMFLRDALISALSLNYCNKEIIIIDDGSTDNTKEVVHKTASEIGIDINYFYQANSGVSAARNKGLDISKGEFLIFLDADDILNIPAYYTLFEVLKKNPNVMAVTGFAQKFKKDKKGNIIFTGSPQESFPYYIGAAVFRHNAFEKVGPFNEELQVSEDTDWFTRAEEESCLIFRADIISLFVRRHAKSLTNVAEIDDLKLISMLKKKIERDT